MKKFTKYISLAGCSLVIAGMATSCDNSKDNGDFIVGGETPNVYFPFTAMVDEILDQYSEDFSFTVYRQNTEGSLTANLTWIGDGAEDFNLPSSVTFADGSKTAIGTVTFDVADLTPMQDYFLTVEINGTEATGFTQNYLEFNVYYTSWDDYGTVEYTDYWIDYFWGTGNLTYEVEIQKHPTIDGFYRLVNPYGEAYPYNEPGDWNEDVMSFMYINATNANQVYICNAKQEAATYVSTMNWNYGNFLFSTIGTSYLISGYSAAMLEAYGYLGYVEDGIIYLPSDSPLVGMANYQGGALNQVEIEGPLEWIVLPGADSTDPTPEE